MRNTILIADSNEVNIEILSELFEEKYTVLTAENGNEASKIIREKGSSLACAILDMDFEDKSAVDILNEVNSEKWFENLPVFVLSSEVSHKIERSAYKAGAIDFSRKPFDSGLLEKRVDKFVDLYGVRENLTSTKEELLKAENKLKAFKDNPPNAQNGGNSVNNISQVDKDILVKQQNKMIQLIGTLVEFRNPENQQHIERVRGIVKIMAKSMISKYPDCGIVEEQIKYIVAAACIHDIGKIAIKDSVLLKPGRLTDEEYEYMKSHTLRGIDVVESIGNIWNDDFSKIANEVIRSHHEKYDGGGYPDGLKGDEIPVPAQLVSIADTYDALVNDRVYKKAYPKDVAYNMIVGGDCGVFPPKIIDCFKESISMIEDWENGALSFDDI